MSKIMIGKYEGSIYEEGGGYTGALEIGYDATGHRIRLKRTGKTKAAVQDKLKKAVQHRDAGLKDAEKYTVAEAVRDWLDKGLKGLDDKTVSNNRRLAENHVIKRIGGKKLADLTADDVDDWLDGLSATLSTSTLHKVHGFLKRAIRQAQARDKVLRNVAELVTTPKGTSGRPSKALTLEQAIAVLEAARSSPLYAYVALSILTGVRTEEARALRWDHVVAWDQEAQQWRPVTEAGFDHERLAVYVWRSVRADGDTKTDKSRRTLELPEEAARALRAHHVRQVARRLKAGKGRPDHGLVFCTRNGTPLAHGNVRRAFRKITKDAGIGTDWVPRELRHTFVSILSDNEVSIEEIADLVGHKTTATTQLIYRHQLKPVISKGAGTINTIFNQHKDAKSA